MGLVNRKILYQLQSVEYEHEFDLKALKSLEGTPGLEKLSRKYQKHYIERIYRLKLTGSGIRVNDKNFPEVHKLLLEACDILQLNYVPELYILWDYRINGFASGSEKPIIGLYSGTIDLLSPEELIYIIGHELGHIKSGHMLYHQIGSLIPYLGEMASVITLGISNIVGTSLTLALLYWYRMSEFTADRAGLLACQNKEAAMSAMMKMSGVPKKYFDKIKTEDFIEQAREFQDFDYDSLDKISKGILIMESTHPWTVMRAHEILKWVDSGAYDQIIEKHSTIKKVSGSTGTMPCLNCGFEITGKEKFCPGCGTRFGRR